PQGVVMQKDFSTDSGLRLLTLTEPKGLDETQRFAFVDKRGFQLKEQGCRTLDRSGNLRLCATTLIKTLPKQLASYDTSQQNYNSHSLMQAPAPKARNMTARGKCEAKRSTSPLVRNE